MERDLTPGEPGPGPDATECTAGNGPDHFVYSSLTWQGGSPAAQDLPPTGNWRPEPVWSVDVPRPRSTWKSAVALVVTLAVVGATIGGIGAAQSDVGEPYDGTMSTSETLSSPNVVPEPRQLRVNPPPPPIFRPSSSDGSSEDWQLPKWGWDTLPQLSDEAPSEWKTLQAPTLALQEPPTLSGCGEPVIVADSDAYEAAIREQWRCVHAAWVPLLLELGLPTAEPEVLFYSGTTGSSDCGRVRAPAFYCPLKVGTVHFGTDDMERAMFWDLGVNDSVHHEYAHHVQTVVGILDASDAVDHTEDIDRRIELQASCWASAMTYRNDSVVFDDDVLLDWRFSIEDSVPDREHGTLASLRYWATRGLYADTLGDCNTWSVNPERVS